MIRVIRLLIIIFLSSFIYDYITEFMSHEFNQANYKNKVALGPRKTAVTSLEADLLANQTIPYDFNLSAGCFVAFSMIFVGIMIKFFYGYKRNSKIMKREKVIKKLKKYIKNVPQNPEGSIVVMNVSFCNNETTELAQVISGEPNVVATLNEAAVCNSPYAITKEVEDTEMLSNIKTDDTDVKKEVSAESSLTSVPSSEINITENPDSQILLYTKERSTETMNLFPDNRKEIEEFDRRLTFMEAMLKESEIRTREWNCRISLAESELIDIHAQIYTIISRLDEDFKKQPNYMIVSDSQAIEETKEPLVGLSGDGNQGFQNETLVLVKVSDSESVSDLNHIMEEECTNDREEMLKNETSPVQLTMKDELQESLRKLEQLVKVRAGSLVNEENRKTPIRRSGPKVPTHVFQMHPRSAFLTNTMKRTVPRIQSSLL